MNLFTKQKQTHRLGGWTCGCQGGRNGRVWIGSLGLTYTHYYVLNRWPTGTCYVVKGALLNILWWPRWERNLKKNKYTYMYG